MDQRAPAATSFASTRRNPARETLSDVPSLHERVSDIEKNTSDLNSAMLGLQVIVKDGFVTVHDRITRMDARIMGGLSTLYDRVDKTMLDNDARDAAATALNASLLAAQEEAAALGAQTGLVAAEASEARAMAHSATNEAALAKKEAADVKAADRGWVYAGTAIGKWAKTHVVTAVIAALAGAVIKHFFL